MRHLSRLPSENDENPNVISGIPICERIEEKIKPKIDDWVNSRIKNDTEEITVDLAKKIYRIIYSELYNMSSLDHKWASDSSIELNIMFESLIHGFIQTFDMFDDKDLFRAALSKTILKSIMWNLKYGILRSFFMNKDIMEISYRNEFDDFY
tara:strand:- start:61 stop:516 length:456 start_codon:yes stop_codon:yes gene_type:complete